jgi:integrase
VICNSELSPDRVRAWRAALLSAGVSVTTAAKAYRLLRAILTTAVEDGLIRRNPCRITRAGHEPTPERPVASVGQALALAAEMPARYRALVLIAAFASLRWGELIALRRRDIDLRHGTVRVRRTINELPTGELLVGPPKSRAGMRHVAIPNRITTELKDHLGQFGESDLSGLIFTGEQGQPLRRSNFNKIVKWKDAVVTVGLPVGFRFHDLRHTGTTLAAETGASTRELMERMGHDSSHAALIYQHGSARRDRAIADALDALIDEERTGENDDREEPTSM